MGNGYSCNGTDIDKGMRKGIGSSKVKGRGIIKMIVSSALLLSMSLGVASASSGVSRFNGFEDVAENQWYYNYIKYMVERGAVNGYGNEKFLPNNNITRVEFATMVFNSVKPKGELAKQAKAEAASNDSRNLEAELEKVNPTYWGNDMIAISEYYGLLGVKNTLAEWSQNITRAEMAELVVNTCEKVLGKELRVADDIKTKIADYNTVRLIPEYEYIAKAYTAGILSGDNHGYYNPVDNATRAEACVIVKNLMGNI